jgi:hypothetical protein
MAAHSAHNLTKLDPAIERWNNMREDVYKHFRFTRRTSWIAFCGFVFVPSALFYIANSTDLKWRWTGKLKNESLST